MNNYKQVRQMIRTGDPILFSGKGKFSFAIKLGTLSPWSHVGIAVWARDIWSVVENRAELGVLEDLRDRLLLLESVTLGKLSDLLARKVVKGVQLVRLADRVITYNGDMIGFRPTYAPRDKVDDITKKFIAKFHGRPYEESKWQLFQSALDLFGLDISDRQSDTSSLFCSELAAEYWMAMGWLEKKKQASNEYVPGDFSGDKLPLVNGVSLGRVELIRTEGT